MDFIKKHKVKLALAVFLLLFFSIIYSAAMQWREDKENAELESEYLSDSTTDAEGPDDGSSDTVDTVDMVSADSSSYDQDEIEYLITRQGELSRKYGNLPEGFIWNMEGELLSLGDPSMSAEESMYAYLNGVSSLDIGTVQRYSRNSYVVKRYSSYFNSKEVEADYKTQFIRNMYRECMLSLQIESVLSSSVFAENKTVFTVKAKILDLTDKDFWVDDKWEIYDNLHIYGLEDDFTKSDIYLYDYILNYYRSGDAKYREVVFDITLERYSDVNSGWLVSIDTDVDDACVYRDGNIVVSYIKEMYNNEGVPKYLEEEEKLRGETSSDDDDEYAGYLNQNRYDEYGNLLDENGNIVYDSVPEFEPVDPFADDDEDDLVWDSLN